MNNPDSFSSVSDAPRTNGSKPHTPAGTGSERPAVQGGAKPRERKDGRPVPSTYIKATIVAQPLGLTETELPAAFAVIRANDPALASKIADFLERRNRVVKDANLIYEQLLRELPDRIAHSEKVNAELDDAQSKMREKRETALSTLLERLQESEKALADRHFAAATTYGDAEGLYDSDNPSEKGLPWPEKCSEAAIAHDNNLPWPLNEATRMPAPLHVASTLLVGCLVGVNTGIALGMLEVDTLLRWWIPTLFAWACGAILVEMAWRLTRAAWQNVGTYLYIEGKKSHFKTWLAVGFIGPLLILGTDMAAIHTGVTTDAASRGITVDGAGAIAYWLFSMIVTLGFIIFAAMQGYVEGRNPSVKTAVLRHQETDHNNRRAAFRSEVKVKGARVILGEVTELKRRRDELLEEVKTASEPFDTRIAALESQRLPGADQLRQDAHDIIEDRQHDAWSAQETLDEMLEKGLAACK